jgi:transglutaminase-like putative cysteine protease
MHFAIRHETVYHYPGLVELGPQLLRLSPRDDGTQRTISHALTIEPQPVVRSTFCDAAGNVVTRCWFRDVTERLSIVSEIEVATLRPDPFDFLPDPSFNAVPAFYPDELRGLLAPYRQRHTVGEDSVWRFAKEVLADSDGTPMGFSLALLRTMSRTFDAQIRDEGAAHPPAQTLAARSGACRDLTVLFIDAARSLGLAARFVSGYRRGDLSRADRHLHAWAEIYVEGGGWRGFDPVEGLAVRDDHVAIASAPDQPATMPVEGGYRGPAKPARLDYTVRITVR